jgi:hypothetical protein
LITQFLVPCGCPPPDTVGSIAPAPLTSDPNPITCPQVTCPPVPSCPLAPSIAHVPPTAAPIFATSHPSRPEPPTCVCPTDDKEHSSSKSGSVHNAQNNSHGRGHGSGKSSSKHRYSKDRHSHSKHGHSKNRHSHSKPQLVLKSSRPQILRCEIEPSNQFRKMSSK